VKSAFDKKVCSRCGVEKLAHHDFYKNKAARGGYFSHCKTCYLESRERARLAKEQDLCRTCGQPKPSDET
jgi:hypothetical protein